MLQTDYLKSLWVKEEVREHREQDLSLHMDPLPETSASLPRDSLQQRKAPKSPLIMQSVTVESENQRRDRKRRLKGVKVLKYGRIVGLIFGAFVLLDRLDDWISSSPVDENSPERIQRDFTRIQSINELTTDSVDTWCYDGQPKCKCQDPLQPVGRDHLKYWHRAHEINIEAAAVNEGEIDVLFLGDSITEGWKGTSYGRTSARTQDVPKVFHKYFSKDSGKYEGLALGISGDTSPNLLWRIKNGEFPEKINPKVIWLLIGTNDIGNTWCSPVLVEIGILRIVQELRLLRPNASIVINGLLPRTFNRKGYVMKGHSKLLSWNRAALPSLWADISAINDDLQHYADMNEKVQYYNTDLFFTDKEAPTSQLRLDSKLMPDHLHPSTIGYELWAIEIVKQLDELLA